MQRGSRVNEAIERPPTLSCQNKRSRTIASPPRSLSSTPPPRTHFLSPLKDRFTKQKKRPPLKGSKAFVPDRNRNRKLSLKKKRHAKPLTPHRGRHKQARRGEGARERGRGGGRTTVARSKVTLAFVPPHKATNAHRQTEVQRPRPSSASCHLQRNKNGRLLFPFFISLRFVSCFYASHARPDYDPAQSWQAVQTPSL